MEFTRVFTLTFPEMKQDFLIPPKNGDVPVTTEFAKKLSGSDSRPSVHSPSSHCSASPVLPDTVFIPFSHLK